MTGIRFGTAADLEAVALIQGASPEAAQWDPGDYLRHDFWVSVQNGCITGFLVTRTIAHDEHEILNLATAPEFRCRGVARELLEAWLAGVSGDVFLEVRASNQSARTLYKSMSFQEVSIRQNYYENPPEAAIVMKFHSC